MAMRTMNMLLLGLMIGALVTFLACRAYAQRRQLDKCETCQVIDSFCDELQRDVNELSDSLTVGPSDRLHASTPPRVHIDIGAIVAIESSGNAAAVGDGGRSVGLCQIGQAAWTECVERMGHGSDWGWEWPEDCFDPGVNRVVGNYYINTRIPKMLRAYKLPDTEPMRLACYCWGIGNVRRQYRADGGIHNFPPQVIQYIEKYRAARAAKG